MILGTWFSLFVVRFARHDRSGLFGHIVMATQLFPIVTLPIDAYNMQLLHLCCYICNLRLLHLFTMNRSLHLFNEIPCYITISSSVTSIKMIELDWCSVSTNDRKEMICLYSTFSVIMHLCCN